MRPPESGPVIVVASPGATDLYLIVHHSLTVGRDCDGLLIADAQVSRRHLELSAADDGLICTDLGSSNGTFLDGERVTAPTRFRPGSEIRLGDTSIRQVDRAEAPTGRATTINDHGAALRRTSIDVVADLVSADSSSMTEDSGTLTMLFSDIESSTERVSRIGDAAWFVLLEHHNDVFRRHLREVDGREIKSQGDGFMLTFPSVRRALTFVDAVQRQLSDEAATTPDDAIRVRMGLHTGEVITGEGGDLFGRHVNKAARIANLAVGGQVLVSETVREIAAGDHRFEFGDGVDRPLKGLDGDHTVYEYHWRR